jgi:hypothetical protein
MANDSRAEKVPTEETLVTFEVGDIVQWRFHPLDPTLIGTLAEITEVDPAGTFYAAFMTKCWTEAFYGVIDFRGNERGARHSWLRRAPPVAINITETETTA